MVSDGRFNYTWNRENRLVKAEEQVCPTNRQPYVIQYAYDHQGRMVLKKISHGGAGAQSWQEEKTTSYLWGDFNIIAETTVEDSATNTTHNIWGLDIDGTLQGAGGVGGLIAVVKDSATYVPAWDGNGNIMEYVSEDGSLAAHYEYSPFGETVIQSDPVADTFAFRFSIRHFDAEASLYYYGYRSYSPSVGRWLNRDPIEEGGGPNVYAYIVNQVFMYVDPFGLQQQNVSCAGTCGAIIDDWVLAEITAQFAGWDSWEKKNSADWLGRRKAITIEDSLKLANGNQRYKDPKFFEFNKGVYPKCGTEDPSKSSVGCGRSVTLCGQSVRSAILWNIMYGIVGRHSGFTSQELRDGATNTKKKCGLLVDKYDEAVYGIGSGVFGKWNAGISIQDFGTKFNSLVQSSPDALREGNRSGGYNDLTTCQPCSEKPRETRHGGSEAPRRRL